MTSVKHPKSIYITILLLVFLIFTGCSGKTLFEEQDKTEQTPAATETQNQLIYFDYEEIDILISNSLDIDIRNNYIFLDDYNDLIINGELNNNSQENITDIEVTFDINDSQGNILFSDRVPIGIRYMQVGKTYPFTFHYGEESNYIKVDNVRIGVNYKRYNNIFLGNPLVREQRYHYQGDMLVVEGNMINIGRKKIEDLMVLATFYDKRGRVLFIRECFIKENSLPPMGEQEYILEIDLRGKVKEFTHYDIEVFFNDAI